MTGEDSRLSVTRREGKHATIATSRLSSSGRPSLLLQWRTAHGTFCGEATPLPGYGSDDIDLAQRELQTLDAGLLSDLRAKHERAPLSLEELEDLSRPLTSPSARFALETIWLRARAQDRQCRVWSLLREITGVEPCAPSELKTSAVLDPFDPSAQRRAAELWSLGLRTFKIKCGRDAEEELRFIARIAELDGVRLRLDPNLAWSRAELDERVDELRSFPIEYIEDPCSDLEGWSAVASIPLAMDEPLGTLPIDARELEERRVRFLILKPMALGGFSRCLRWAHVGARARLPSIVSHLFDGPVALDAAVELAFAVQSPGFAAGLGLHAGLAAFSGHSQSVTVERIQRP